MHPSTIPVLLALAALAPTAEAARGVREGEPGAPVHIALGATDPKSLFEQAGSDPEAVSRLKQGAQRGDALSQFYLGMLNETGRGVPQDDVQAEMWYQLSAQAGIKEASARLNALAATVAQKKVDAEEARLRREADVRKAEADRVEALRKAEADRVAAAADRLVIAFNLAKAGDKTKFAELLALAKQGHAEAQNFVGACFQGGYGTETDKAEAIRWWLRSSRQGNPNARKNIEMMSRAGYMIDVIERTLDK